MSDIDEAAFAALAARLTDPTTPLPKATNVLTGEAAAAAGRAFMLREYGSQEALDAELRSAGRPRRGERPKGQSPTVRGRIPAADRAAFDELIRETGKKESELVREALHLLLEHHRMAG